MLKPYFGWTDMAKRAAMLDFDQFEVVATLHFVGEQRDRKTLEFQVQYADTSTYVVPFTVGEFSNARRKVAMHCDLLKVDLTWNADMCKCLGQYTQWERASMIRVDARFLVEHPQVLKSLEG
jgi:hypothetical protein